MFYSSVLYILREVTGSNPVEVLIFFFFLGFFTQLHKLRSLRRSFLHLQCSIPPTVLEVSHMWNQDPTQHTVYSTYIKYIFFSHLYCIVGPVLHPGKMQAEERMTKELGEP